jgi:hypothetical protein
MNLAYLGTIPMVLAIAGLFIKSMPRQAKWLIVLGLLIPITPLVGPLYHRVQLLFLLGGAWMAAEMLARLPLESPRFLVRGVSAVVIAIGVALLIGTCLPGKVRTTVENTVVAKSVAASAGSNFGNDQAWIEKRARGWTDRFSLLHPRTAWVYGLLVAGLAGLVIATRTDSAKAPLTGQAAIIAVSSLELLTLFQTWVTFSNPQDLRPLHPAIEQLRVAAGEHKVLQRTPAVPFADIFASPNLLSSYGIPSVDTYESIHYRTTFGALASESPETRLSLAGVGVAIQPTASLLHEGTEHWPVIETISGYTIRRNPAVPPPLAAGTGDVPKEPAHGLATLARANALLPVTRTMNRESFEIPDGSTWVRLSRNWHKGWQWRTGGGSWQPFQAGQDAACWITNPPASATLIETRFFPRPGWLLALSTGASLISLAAASHAYLRRRRSSVI